ncbi:MAG: UDP-N-acetylmuramate--L-alanine ligase [Armatimonadota bacterium]
MVATNRIQLRAGQRIHLIGVGGVGMSALAAILAHRGFSVSGSDRSEGPHLERLRELGVHVSVPQTVGGAGDADVVVRSTAIPDDNPELADARDRGLPVYHRSELLAAIVRGMTRVAVSGTHGKTTTTAMLATIMVEAGRDPLAIIGGDAANIGENYHLGSEPLAIFEACESDASFLRYGPCSEIITNVEPDHLDQHGTFDEVRRVFGEFVELVPADGFLAWSAEDAHLRDMARRCRGESIPCGLRAEAAFSADGIELRPFGAGFRLLAEGRAVGRVELQVPGEHNVRNALLAVAAATRLGLSAEEAAAGLAHFRGVGRRFELLGELDGALVIDDYAHHPTEVSATLAAARRGWPNRRIIAIFQPHLYSRTRDFGDDFAEALAAADVVIVADIYGAREQPIDGVCAEDLAERVARRAPGRQVRFLPDNGQILEAVRALAKPGDLIMTLGAGDIRQVGEALVCG